MENVLGEPELADERWEHALRIAQATGQEQAVAVLQHRLADMARRLRGDLPGARALAEASLDDSSSQRLPKGRNTGAHRTRRHRAGRRPSPSRRSSSCTRARASPRRSAFVGGSPASERGSAAPASRSGGSKRRLRTHGKPSRFRRPYETAEQSSPSSSCSPKSLLLQGAASSLGPVRCGRGRERARAWSPWFHAPHSPERVLAHADSEFEGGRGGGPRSCRSRRPLRSPWRPAAT